MHDIVKASSLRGRGRPCLVCNSAKRGEIEAALTEGLAYKTIQRDTGVSHTSIRNHFFNHMTVYKEAQAMRQFEKTSIVQSGHTQSAYRVTCTKCEEVGKVVASGHTSSLPREVIAKKFGQMGWALGKSPSKDVCPVCAKKPKTETVAPAIPAPAIEPAVTQLNPSMFTPVPQPPITEKPVLSLPEKAKPVISLAEPPAAPTREDKRIVLAKLQEVYLDETRGYCEGWNDNKVASDLGVPRAWVVTLREDNFGPENSSPEDRDTVQTALELKRKIDALTEDTLKEFKQRQTELREMREKLSVLMPQTERLMKHFGLV
jgi:hypothetical protein